MLSRKKTFSVVILACLLTMRSFPTHADDQTEQDRVAEHDDAALLEIMGAVGAVAASKKYNESKADQAWKAVASQAISDVAKSEALLKQAKADLDKANPKYLKTLARYQDALNNHPENARALAPEYNAVEDSVPRALIEQYERANQLVNLANTRLFKVKDEFIRGGEKSRDALEKLNQFDASMDKLRKSKVLQKVLIGYLGIEGVDRILHQYDTQDPRVFQLAHDVGKAVGVEDLVTDSQNPPQKAADAK